MRPKVTIGICVRNSAATLAEAIRSILRQTYPHELMEVIFVDDGSEDQTLAIINNFASNMKMEVKIFHHKWKGLGPSRNIVVNNAKGKYIIWVDGDMILPADYVEKQVEFMEKNLDVGIGKARHGLLQENSVVAFLEHIPFMVYDFKNVSLESKLPGTGGAIYRVKAIREVGGFDENLKGTGEDQDAAYRIKAAGWRIERTPAYFYERRVKSWTELWRKYFWYGYGDYYLYWKNRKIFSLPKMNPIAGLVAGILFAKDAYIFTHSNSLILLPFHYAFKLAAWCYGFLRANIGEFG